MNNNHLSRRRLISIVLAFVMISVFTGVVFADSPPNITTDIEWDEDPVTGGNQQTYAGVAAIEAAFNNARRQEESQLSLAANTLGTLDLPDQATWDSYSDDQKALHIINEERVDRAGMTAGVIGLPLTGILNELDDLAQYYADFMLAHNATGHYANGISPYDRIDYWPLIGSCHEFMARAENLAYFWSTTAIPLPVERAIYNWIYDDASSAWGHREAVLLQDKDLNGNSWGYTNNAGSAADEGYLGIGVATGPHNGWPNSYMVVMKIIDPVAGDCSNADNTYDFSDASTQYDFASHENSGPYFGAARTAGHAPAIGGGVNDGVVRSPGAGSWSPGGTGSVDVTVGNCTGTCYLSAWIDWDNDGSFGTGAEQVLTNQAVSNGSNLNITFSIPSPAPACYGGTCNARFRLYPTEQTTLLTTGIDSASAPVALPSPTGAAGGGEAEDYGWAFGPSAVTLGQVDAGNGIPNSLFSVLLLTLVLLTYVGLVFIRRRRMSALPD